MGERILVVDDHSEIIYAVRRVLTHQGYEVLAATSSSEAVRAVERVDLAVVDIRLGNESGLELLGDLRAAGHDLPVIVLSAHTSPENVVEASKRGASEVLRKPLSQEQLVEAVHRALRHPRSGSRQAGRGEDAGPAVMGSSAQMLEVFKLLGLAAANELNVLLTGETGVGKEVAARIIHEHSERSRGPFVAVNCTALPETLLEAELFGHGPGAFTGAGKGSVGKVEAATGGTLLLDEIGDMPMAFQAKLLRFLEDKSYYRLGESEPRHADVRVLAATNQNLAERVDGGYFRNDLYYRLAQVPVNIPPLRERPEDIPQLIEEFIRLANRELDAKVEGITPEALADAGRHRWDGNIRELRNAVYRAVAGERSGTLSALDMELRRGVNGDGGGNGDHGAFHAAISQAVAGGRVLELIDRFEEQVLAAALDHYGGNKTRVAEELDMSRNTLRAKLRKHGMAADTDS